ncbi:DUF3883 domain-containing protein [Hydrogenimonas sp.]
MSSFEIDYEEDLLPRIRDLIDGYDKDSILKEYLQNADDSGATELIVTFDKQKYIYLNNTKFEAASGNALLIYNNSQFKEKDFKSIVKISAQGKTDDANSTGRFGQGFSSSFSISDHPSFISNGRVYWFDVLKVAVSQDKEKSIQVWEYQKSKEIKSWLQTFKVAGFENQFKGTIFRLPLRDEISSKKSKISNEIFTYEDFLKWVEEWKNNSENLLFLRHIHRLVLQESDEFGNIKALLEIKTKNKDEIENINSQIQNEFNKKTLIEICEAWKSYDAELPLFNYKQKFEIKYYNHQTEYKTYAVVNGLFRGKNNSLVDLAKKVLSITPNPRKVLPWAGVAVEINNKNEPIKAESKLFTFLPLPIKYNYPVKIHGWFDLNPKRTEITNSGSGDDKETLIKWNQLLLKEGVAKAWSLLIDYLKKDSKANYTFWAKDTEFALNDYLIEGFYENISNLKCLYTTYQNKKEWLSPKENTLYYLKIETTNKILLNALQEHFKITLSKPQNFIIENFKKVGIELIEITPEFLRDYLKEESKNIEFPITIEKIPITMLNKKEWLIEVLKYCADSEEDYSLLEGLPLELTLDSKIYKVDSDTLFDEKANLKLFQNLKYLFIDKNIVNAIKNTNTLPNSWLQPTLNNKLSLLLKYWEELKITKEWISEVVNEIINSLQDEVDEALENIQKLKIVYQENNDYATLKSDIENFSPFMPKDEDIPNNIKYLEKIEMNIVHRDYIDLYKPLLKYDGLITQLSSDTLIKHLLNLDDFSFFEDKDTREYIIDILTENIEWFNELDEYEKDIFCDIPFIETVDGNLYAKYSDVKLYLPSDFTPPKHIKSLTNEYEVISVEQNTNLYSLYEKMDIDKQNIDNYIQEVIIPFLENTDNILDRKEVLKWLATEWSNIKGKIDDKTFEDLKNSKNIPSYLDENQLFKTSELYVPDIKLPKIIDDNQFKPIIFEEESINKEWIEFLSSLGASKEILSTHIIIKVKEIAEQNNKNGAIELLNHIANNFEMFEKMDILDTLKEYAWFPVEKPKDILKPENEYSPLKKPNELILSKEIKIAGGYYHLLDSRVKLGKKDERGEIKPYEMAKKLGITTNIPNEHFFESFRELIKLSPTDGQVVNYAKDVYKYIGRRFKGGNEIELDEDEKTILINNRWIEPKYVYQSNINLSNVYSWNSLVKDDIESDLAKGLKLLGVQEKPSFDFLIEELKRLPENEKLKDSHLRDAKAILKAIQEDEDNEVYDGVPILTQKNMLVDSSKVYINDFPAYKNAKEKNEDLNFCQVQFEGLAKRLNVLSINEKYESNIYSYEECETSHPIVEIIETDYFKEALLRLLYHEKKIEKDKVNEFALYEVLPSNIIFVTNLIIEYSIEDNFLFRSDEATYEKNGELYILEQDDEDDMIEVIAKYICDKKNLSRDSFGWIERILRKQMNREEIHNFLDKKKVVELPKKLDIDDEPSLFDENTNLSESNNETVYDTSTTQEEDYPKRDIEETESYIKAKTSSTNGEKTSKTFTSQKDSKPKGEIAPPIQPKTSFEKEKVDRENSSLSHSNKQENRTNNFEGRSSNKSNKKIVSSNDRKPVYVWKDREVDEEQQKSQRESAKNIGDKGETYILDNKVSLLLSSENYFEKALTNNKGFDIYEKDQSGETIRYIEVKTLTGQWGEGGVSLTPTQFEFAKKNIDKWWLFVVEGINTETPKVYQFKNPVIEVNQFMFDSSWKQLAYQKEDIANQEPKVGDRYEIEIDDELKIVEILNIQGKGALSKVELVLENGQKLKPIRFKKSWTKIDG